MASLKTQPLTGIVSASDKLTLRVAGLWNYRECRMGHELEFETNAACEERILAYLEDVGLGASNRAQSLSNEVRNFV